MNMTADGDDTGAKSGRAAAKRHDETLDFDEGMRELAELATAELSLRGSLTKVAEYAVRAIPGADGAGLTLIAKDRSETLVSTSRLVTDVDAIQYGIRQGPCITAAAQAKAVWSHSLGEDDRWPVFGPQVAHLGVHSALSLPLITPNRVVGAMNIYARQKHTFSERVAELGQLYAVPAAIAVQNAEVLNGARALASRLQQALTSQAVIDRAIGVVIGRNYISHATAAGWLRESAESQGLTLLQVAEQTVEEAVRRGPGQDIPGGLVDGPADHQRFLIIEDRERIARDLHDHVIQGLFASSMNLESVVGLITDPGVRARLVRTVDDLDGSIRQIRSTIFALQDSRTDPTSIRSMVMKVVGQVSPVLGFRPQTRLNGPLDTTADEAVAEDVEAVLRESLTNVAKHARASAVQVDVTALDRRLTVVVTDNGVGRTDPDRNSGLSNLRERAKRRGGSLTLTNQPDGGLQLTWLIPLTV